MPRVHVNRDRQIKTTAVPTETCDRVRADQVIANY